MGANATQKFLMTGSTFAATWAMVQHGGEGAIVAAVLASLVLSNADKIIDKFAGGKSSQPDLDDYPTEEEIAAYRRLQASLPTNADVEQEIRRITQQQSGRDDARDLQAPKKGGIFHFSEVLRLFTPTLDKIYLATLPNGTSIFCDYKALCHVALAGATDAGKSNLMRMLTVQLCYVGCKVLILNPHWTGYVLDKQEDWTPIIPYLFDDPMSCRKYDKIEYYLNYLANKTVPHRLELYAHSKPTGTPIFVVIDELPAIVKRLETVPGYLDTILKEGRKVGVYLISAAQDFLVNTIGGTGAVRDCYRTAYSVGGDDTTTNKLLGKTKADRPLGKGVVLLRNASNDLCKEAVTALVPLVDNESLYRLLGPSTYVPSMDVNTDDLEDFELDDAKARMVGDIRRAPSERDTRVAEPSNDKPSVKPNVEKQLRSDDLHIDTLTQAWNAGINTVSAIEKFFKMSHGEAYKAYNRVKAVAKDPTSEE